MTLDEVQQNIKPLAAWTPPELADVGEAALRGGTPPNTKGGRFFMYGDALRETFVGNPFDFKNENLVIDPSVP